MLGEVAILASGVAAHLHTSCCVALRTGAGLHSKHPCKPLILLIFDLHAQQFQNTPSYV